MPTEENLSGSRLLRTVLVLVLSMAVAPRAAQGRWQLLSDLTLTTRYDTNIQMTANGKSDMVYLIGPRVGIKYEGTDMSIAAGYRVNAELFGTHHDLNRIRQDLSIDTDFSRTLASLIPRKANLRIKENIYYTPILPDFESLLTASSDETTGGIRTPRTNTLRNVFDLSAARPLSLLTNIEFGYRNVYTLYQDRALIDSQTNTVRVGFRTDMSRTDTLTTRYSYGRFNPDNDKITHIHSFTLGERHDFSPILTGNAGLGVTATVSPGLDRPRYSGHGNLSITRQLREKIQLSARVSRSIETGSGIAATALIADSGGVSLNRQFSSALSADAALNIARNHSIEKETGDRIDVYSQGARIGIHYQLTSWLISDLGYSYFRQETAGNFQADLTRNQYSFSLRTKGY